MQDVSLPHPHTVFTGLLAAFVGFASSFAVVLNGLTAVGATPAQASSGLMALSICMGVCGLWVSMRTHNPISVAWSTPGAALLATSGPVDGGFSYAVGAFLVSALLVVLAGTWRPLARWVSAIPASLANALLAGILLNLCLAPVRAIGVEPVIALLVIVTWALVTRYRRLLAVPIALAVMIIALVSRGSGALAFASLGWLGTPQWVTPTFSLSATVGIALPLFIVTMASQNIPGLAVLRVNGYTPQPAPLFRVTGLFSLLAAPFGGHAVNLAAITAALCAGPDAHPDPSKRYWASAVTGVTYVVFGLFAGIAGQLVAIAPPVLIEAVAGLALLGAFGAALSGAVAEPEDREAALVTFMATAAGVTFWGISGAFWGLLAGAGVRALTRMRRPLDS